MLIEDLKQIKLTFYWQEHLSDLMLSCPQPTSYP